MQNAGVNTIVACIHNAQMNHPTGMVVFYYQHTYSSAGYIETDPVPKGSPTALVYHDMPPEISSDPTKYRVAGVTVVDNQNNNNANAADQHLMRAGVHISGSVTFCNTGDQPISAGDEVWAQLLDRDTTADSCTAPVTIGRDSSERIAELGSGYKYVGRCVMGAMPSHLPSRRFCYGQLLLSLN